MTRLNTFQGGIHPPELKSTSEKAIVSLPAPSRVVLPLAQHIGAPCKPCVAIGDKVEFGQVIGEPGGFVSAPIHATVSGKVTAIGSFLHPLGAPVLSIVIERDPQAVELQFAQVTDGQDLAPEEIRKRVLAAGVVGLGGATFPTHVKLSPPPAKPIDTVILNGVECEPGLTSDHRMMLEEPDKIIAGLRLIMKTLGAGRGIIGIEANKPDAIELFTKKCSTEKGMEVCALKVQYPQGGEKQLIDAALGRQVPSGGLPMDVGVVVQNVGTAAAIFEAVCCQKPLLERVVTLAGGCVASPGNYRVRIGTLIEDFLAAAGGLRADVPLKKAILGGPMMGYALFDLKVPIVKGASGILLWNAEEAVEIEPGPCLRCGRCIRGCPIHLMPQRLNALIQFERWAEVETNNVLDCMECGCCAYICPARLPLVQTMRLGKKLVAAEKKRKADVKSAKGGKA